MRTALAISPLEKTGSTIDLMRARFFGPNLFEVSSRSSSSSTASTELTSVGQYDGFAMERLVSPSSVVHPKGDATR